MRYPKTPPFRKLTDELDDYARLKAEYGAKGISGPLVKAERALRAALRELKKLPVDRNLAKREPNDIERIRELRAAGPRRIWAAFDPRAYRDRLQGALLGRFAGCILGAPVELWPVEKMEALAAENGDAFPPTDYWCRVPEPKQKRYQVSPRGCALRKAIQWALRIAPEIGDYQQAREAVAERFKGMHDVHTINNACLTVFGITIGGKDFTRVIGETVAMGMDNDCTAATAGSIVGAVVGKRGIPARWYKGFDDTIHTYLLGRERFSIRDVHQRFERLARELFSRA